jgi:hypothetical protein
MKNLKYLGIPSLFMVCAFSVQSVSATTVYSENFEGVTREGAYTGSGAYSYGYDKNNDTAQHQYKELFFDTWYSQAESSEIVDVDGDGDLELRPNLDTKKNGKLWGIVLDPSTFTSTGSGTYTFSVNLVGADEGTSLISVWSASGAYDSSGNNDLILDVAEASLSEYQALSGTGNTVVNEIFTHEIADETASGTYTTNFYYTEGDAIAITFGSYNTSFAYDDLVISTYAGVDSDADGLSDSDEINTHNTDPNNADSDGDGFRDGDEVSAYLTNPLSEDSDGDTLSDFAEITSHNTDPNNVDTNNDGLRDQLLVELEYNPSSDYTAMLTDDILNAKGFYQSSVPQSNANAQVVAKSNNSANVRVQVERSSNLNDWSAESSDVVNFDLNMGNSGQYMRFSIADN